MIPGDRIVVGGSKPVRIVNIDYFKNQLTLERSISWKHGDPVNLVFKGKAPDIGAFEHGAESELPASTAK